MYTTRMTSVLTGATPRQLRHWRQDKGQGTLLVPARGPGRQSLYSFQDVVALRMFVALRQQTSLQKVRKAVAYLLEQHPVTHLSAHSLKAGPGGKTIVWIADDGDFVDVVEHPGQPGIRVIMEQIFGEFTTEFGRMVPDLRVPAPGLAIDREIRGGYPVLKGTRLPFDAVSSLVSDGLTDAEIIEIYPTATPEGISGARRFAEMIESSAPAA
jgi:uncharacterized protein (DUF433 family)/DNA-binding transcriptional MerR regulator